MMATSEDFRRVALGLADTTEHPHMDRRAFKIARIYATMAADGRTANLKFTPDEQEFKCSLAPEIFRPLANGWGRQGWTEMDISAATIADLQAALELAHSHALKAPKRRA